jgi:hypothetical protein
MQKNLAKKSARFFYFIELFIAVKHLTSIVL